MKSYNKKKTKFEACEYFWSGRTFPLGEPLVKKMPKSKGLLIVGNSQFVQGNITKFFK